MKYDDASWHYGGTFPKDLPAEAGATHIGMFVAWAWLKDLAGPDVLEDMPDAIAELKARSITPGDCFLQNCDGKFTDADLNDLGNEFASAYFDFKNGEYAKDYDDLLTRNLPSTYHVADTWENFDKLQPIIDQRYDTWLARRTEIIG